jgi:hypothetical protein
MWLDIQKATLSLRQYFGYAWHRIRQQSSFTDDP